MHKGRIDVIVHCQIDILTQPQRYLIKSHFPAISSDTADSTVCRQRPSPSHCCAMNVHSRLPFSVLKLNIERIDAHGERLFAAVSERRLSN